MAPCRPCSSTAGSAASGDYDGNNTLNRGGGPDVEPSGSSGSASGTANEPLGSSSAAGSSDARATKERFLVSIEVRDRSSQRQLEAKD